jgi:hypothetical protein
VGVLREDAEPSIKNKQAGESELYWVGVEAIAFSEK